MARAALLALLILAGLPLRHVQADGPDCIFSAPSPVKESLLGPPAPLDSAGAT